MPKSPNDKVEHLSIFSMTMTSPCVWEYSIVCKGATVLKWWSLSSYLSLPYKWITRQSLTSRNPENEINYRSC